MSDTEFIEQIGSHVVKDYDVLRCVYCDGIMKVPLTVMTFICPHCGKENEFTVVTEATLEEPINDDLEVTNPKTNASYIINVKRKDELVVGDVTWTWCRRHQERTEHLWTGHELVCLDCWPSKRPKEQKQ